jgi:shikimate kinase
MGVGKSTVGRRCAERLGWTFVDTDDVVIARVRMPLGQALATLGEDRLRDLEQAVVAETVASRPPLVIACGGGTVIRAENRDLLRSAGVVIWLRAPTSVLIGRVGEGDGRPMLTGTPAEALERLGAVREPAYEAAADRVVNAARDVDEVTDAVLATFREALRSPTRLQATPAAPST